MNLRWSVKLTMQIELGILGKTTMSNIDQFLEDKMWTLRLDRVQVLARPLETPKQNGSLYRR